MIGNAQQLPGWGLQAQFAQSNMSIAEIHPAPSMPSPVDNLYKPTHIDVEG